MAIVFYLNLIKKKDDSGPDRTTTSKVEGGAEERVHPTQSVALEALDSEKTKRCAISFAVVDSDALVLGRFSVQWRQNFPIRSSPFRWALI